MRRALHHWGSRTALAALLLAVVPLAAGTRPAHAQEADPVSHAGLHPVYEFRNGRWFDGDGFVRMAVKRGVTLNSR